VCTTCPDVKNTLSRREGPPLQSLAALDYGLHARVELCQGRIVRVQIVLIVHVALEICERPQIAQLQTEYRRSKT